MLVTEQMFLLLRRDDGRSEGGSGYEAYGLNGAVLTDLLMAGHVTLDDSAKDPRITVAARGSVGDPVLDATLDRLRAKKDTKLVSLILDLSLSPRDEVVQSLVSAGVITIAPKRALGLVPERYPVRDPAPERALRERLRVVLAGGSAQPGEAALLALLKGLGLAPHLLKEEKGSLARRDLDRRIDEASSDSAVGTALRTAVEQVEAAVMVATSSS